MQRPGLRDLLVRAVLDREVRNRFHSDPGAILDQFELSDSDREAVLNGDGRILWQIAPDTAPIDTIEQDSSGLDHPTRSQTAPPLAIRLLLRIMFSAVAAENGQLQLHYAPMLEMLNEHTDPKSNPRPQIGQDILPGTRLQDALFEIRVLPTVLPGEGGEFALSCRQSLLPVSPSNAAARSETGTGTERELSVLAQRVHSAPTLERRTALLELLQAIEQEVAGA